MTRSERRKVGGTQASGAALDMPVRWLPCGDGSVGPAIVVTQGDLTACALDAIVNPANSQLAHGGGVAGAISRKGGRVIDDESRAWIKENKQLPVGHAMSTSAGRLPCRFAIHTVGPMIGGGGFKQPTTEQAQQLRDAVWNALCEAERLRVASVAMPGISSGIFGYPRDLAAKEILGECVRFAREKTSTTTLKEIVLMNIDPPTCSSFVRALQEEMEFSAREEAPEEEEEEVLPLEKEEEAVEELKPPLKPVSFDMAALSVAVALVVAWLSSSDRHHKLSLCVMHRNAASRVVGDVGTLSMHLLRQSKPQQIPVILQLLKGSGLSWQHERQTQPRMPFYMKPS